MLWGQQQNFQKYLWRWGDPTHKSSKASSSPRLHMQASSQPVGQVPWAVSWFSCSILGQMMPLAVTPAVLHLLPPVPRITYSHLLPGLRKGPAEQYENAEP